MTDRAFIALGALEVLAVAGYDITVGSRKADGAEGFYASLEHLDLAEPEEFYGDTPPEAIRRAFAWAVAKAQSGNIADRNRDSNRRYGHQRPAADTRARDQDLPHPSPRLSVPAQDYGSEGPDRFPP